MYVTGVCGAAGRLAGGRAMSLKPPKTEDQTAHSCALRGERAKQRNLSSRQSAVWFGIKLVQKQ